MPVLGFLNHTVAAIIILIVALLSGPLAVCREIQLMYFPAKAGEKRVFWGFVRIAFVIAAFLAWANEHRKVSQLTSNTPSLEIRYHDQKLDGQPIMLVEVTDFTAHFFPDMFTDNRWPGNFYISGISIANEGNALAEVHLAVLTFPTKVTMIPSYGWQPTNPEGTEFSESWGKTLINPSQPPVPVSMFVGSPIPRDPMKVKLTIFYDSNLKKEAAFMMTSHDRENGK